jgi:hypothetical protein
LIFGQPNPSWFNVTETFSRINHVYKSPDFQRIIAEEIIFLQETPAQKMPPSEKFDGPGVYQIYCTANSGIYSRFHNFNRTFLQVPIYIGKAVPKGWRQGRQQSSTDRKTNELYQRSREHTNSISQGEGLRLEDYYCRFIILEGAESSLISTLEAALIRQYQPLWNTVIDGFGNHDPGKGRYQQSKSDWDVCHPGRPWAERCQGVAKNKEELYAAIDVFFDNLELSKNV